jgi:anti-sigma factor RsiW
MEVALALTETQTARLHRVAEYQNATTYEVLFLALEEYLAEKEDEQHRAADPRQAQRRRELLRSFAGIERG